MTSLLRGGKQPHRNPALLVLKLLFRIPSYSDQPLIPRPLCAAIAVSDSFIRQFISVCGYPTAAILVGNYWRLAM